MSLTTMPDAKPRIAVLDDYHGLSLDHFDRPGWSVTVFRDTLLPYGHPGTPESERDELVRRLKDFDIICTMRERTPFPAALIDRLPNLKLLLTTGQRNASIDLAACAARGIPVAGTVLLTGLAAPSPDGGPLLPDSTTEHCVSMILALARGIARDDQAVKDGRWQTGWATRLAGKTLGVVGLGRLGSAVARIMAVGFGMRVVAWSENLTQEKADQQARAVGLPAEDGRGEKSFRVVGREELFAGADVVTVHLVLSDRSRGLIRALDLERMKSSAYFVNTSRGPLVVEDDLLAVLGDGKIAGAGLDVFDVEPLPGDSVWRTTRWGEKGRSEVLLTPHTGYVEKQSFAKWYEQQARNVQRWLEGEELEVVIAPPGKTS